MSNPSQRHIALKGTKQGKWVPCKAEIRCRNGGKHIKIDDLYRARDKYKTKTGIFLKLDDVPLKVVTDMIGSTSVQPDLILASKYEVSISPSPAPRVKTPLVKRHFNETSDVMDLVQSFYSSGEQIVYPVTRIARFDTKRTPEYVEGLKWAGTHFWDARGFKKVLHIENDSRNATLKIEIKDDATMERWLPIEVSKILSWDRIDSEMKDKKLPKKERFNHPHMEEHLKVKDKFINMLTNLGMKNFVN